ncbi:MAG: hypothetical protein OEW87_12565, partial [Flavobacteriaceae bacterium]|nr:hypothetical protein [Flavobacteriaceae bacterium]
IRTKYNFGNMLSIRQIVDVNKPDEELENIHKASEKVKKHIVVLLTIDSEDKKTTSKLIDKLKSFEHDRISSVVLDSNYDNSIRTKVYSCGYQYVGEARSLSMAGVRSIFKSSIGTIINRYRKIA